LHPHQVKRDLISEKEIDVGDETVVIKKRIEGDIVIKNIIFPGRAYEEKVKLYSRSDIEKMLDENQLKVLNVWNDYEGNPWKEEGDRQLFRCQGR